MAMVTIANVSGFIAIAVLTSKPVAGRTVQNSIWPTLLQSDAVALKGVRKRVLAVTWIQTLGIPLIGIAGVVTPLGLYSSVVAEAGSDQVFEYVKDAGPFGIATPGRSDIGFCRRCGAFVPVLCPGSTTPYNLDGNFSQGSISMPQGYDGHIPKDRFEFFGSGINRNSDTISGVWDIDWRNYNYRQDKTQNIPMNNGSKYVSGAYSVIDNTISTDKVQIIEGLIVDSKGRGIGFRNHTLPLEVHMGAQWSEDILFTEPETVCVPNNITLDFTLAETDNINSNGSISDLRITDRGGFFSIGNNATDAQEDIDIHHRAYVAAWINNVVLMWYFNITNPGKWDAPGWPEGGWSYLNSEQGRTFSVGTDRSTPVFQDRLRSVQLFSDFLQLDSRDNIKSNLTFSPSMQSNPFNITRDHFELINDWCQWFKSNNPGTISTIALGCSMVYGVAQSLDSKKPGLANIYDAGSKWSIPLYSCATASKASIKTVDFKLNGTGLADLRVLAIKDKIYDNQGKPHWAVEETNMRLLDGAPLWGLVDPDLEPVANISTIQREYLYLPGFVDPLGWASISVQNMPAIDFHIAATSVANQIGKNTVFQTTDYTGKYNAAMYAKWRELSKDPVGTAQILNLVWTDIAANAVVGTKGLGGARLETELLAKRSDSLSPNGSHKVVLYQSRVLYKWPYAIPAFLVILLILAVGVAALFSCFASGFGLKSISVVLERTSLGRVMAAVAYPYSCPPGLKTKEWITAVGNRGINYSGQFPRETDALIVSASASQEESLGNGGAYTPLQQVGN
ncbi:hypothetical protein B0O99DRAFT_520839 [Bisporella sp. PMI_857]|nr:hypothetical protein B0O99DRAFT_520839 [Bisporella sp. PMI_857]